MENLNPILKILKSKDRDVFIKIKKIPPKTLEEILGRNLHVDEVVKVPLWLADEMVSLGIAERIVKWEKGDVSTWLLKEKTMKTPTKLPETVYVDLLFLDSKGKIEKPIWEAMRKIVIMRCQKILRLALSPADVDPSSLGLTPEERVLYIRVKSLIQGWLSVFNRGVVGKE